MQNRSIKIPASNRQILNDSLKVPPYFLIFTVFCAFCIIFLESTHNIYYNYTSYEQKCKQ